MKRLRQKEKHFNADGCLEALRQFRIRHREYLRDNKDLARDIDKLQAKVEEFSLMESKLIFIQCQKTFRDVLSRFEEIAEDQQRFYDESPSAPKIEAVYQSTKDFEAKKDFETSLSSLL